MNIQFFTPKFITNNNNRELKQNKYVQPSLKPLTFDTVQFTAKSDIAQKAKDVAKTKVFEFWNTDAKNFEEIVRLVESFKKPLEKFKWDLKRAMKNLVVNEAHPDNIIMPGERGIKSRVKRDKEIAAKANSRQLFTIDQITKMGDVGGARIVMRSASWDDTAKIFDALKDMIKQGYKIREVENYRTTVKESYVSQKTLDKFEEYCIKHGQYPVVTNRSLPNSYSATHLTFELPDGKYIELQIMGRDLENVKEVEDFFYKNRCNKKFNPKYKIIQRVFDKYMPTLDEFQKETLSRYIKDSYEYARKIPPRSAKIKFNPSKEFLPFPYSLPQELSFENIHRMIEKCQ